MYILGIETSCDETAAAVIEGKGEKIKVLSNVVSSQIDIHQKYGGVVPEVAAREHVLNILPVVNEALEKAGLKGKEKKLSAIAATSGPGLVTSLIVGLETAKTLSYGWGIPAIDINHIEGHIYANWIEQKKIKFPALILTVSGGHTMLVLMKGHGKYKTIGETRDDAAGEAFDKAAQLLQLGYPGGPAIAAKAAELRIINDELRIKLPRPMMNSGDFDFSFSGLKTALLYEIKKDKNWKKRKAEYAYEFEQAVSDVLVAKTIKAAQKNKIKTILLSGGVAANKKLRNNLEIAFREKLTGVKFHMPEFKYCTDNAAMVATAGYFKAQNKKFTTWQKLKVDANKELK